MTGIKEKKTDRECSSASHKSLQKCTQQFVQVALLFSFRKDVLSADTMPTAAGGLWNERTNRETTSKKHREENQKRETSKTKFKRGKTQGVKWRW